MRALLLSVISALLLPCAAGVGASDPVQLSRRSRQPGRRGCGPGRAHHRRRARPEHRASRGTAQAGRARGPERRHLRLLASRFQLRADGALMQPGSWSTPEPLAERQSLRISTRFTLQSAPGIDHSGRDDVPVRSAHQSFINFYENDALALAGHPRQMRRPRSSSSPDPGRACGPSSASSSRPASSTS